MRFIIRTGCNILWEFALIWWWLRKRLTPQEFPLQVQWIDQSTTAASSFYKTKRLQLTTMKKMNQPLLRRVPPSWEVRKKKKKEEIVAMDIPLFMLFFKNFILTYRRHWNTLPHLDSNVTVPIVKKKFQWTPYLCNAVKKKGTTFLSVQTDTKKENIC